MESASQILDMNSKVYFSLNKNHPLKGVFVNQVGFNIFAFIWKQQA